MPHPPLEVRFWRNTKREGACLVWTGKRYRNGYGSLMHGKRYRLAHRIAWELTHGREPDGVVMHTCDTPECVEPSHLVLGTQRDNMRDMVRKGRAYLQRTGTDHPASGRVVGAETREKIRQAKLGKPRSQETKDKISRTKRAKREDTYDV